MKNALEQIRVAFNQIDHNNIKKDDTLLIICHTNENEFATAMAGNPIEMATTLASAMEKDSDLETVVRMALFAFDCINKKDSQPENEPETEAENQK